MSTRFTSGIRATKTARRRAKVEKVWDAFKERDLSFSYKDFLVVFTEMFGKTGAPTKQQLLSDLRSFAGYVNTTQALVAGVDYRHDLSWVGAIRETIYYHGTFGEVE